MSNIDRYHLVSANSSEELSEIVTVIMKNGLQNKSFSYKKDLGWELFGSPSCSVSIGKDNRGFMFKHYVYTQALIIPEGKTVIKNMVFNTIEKNECEDE